MYNFNTDNRKENQVEKLKNVPISVRPFDLENPSADDVDFVEIAHVLAHTCCYGGRTRDFYSYAERCVRLAGHVSFLAREPQAKFYALLHHAHVAYLGDITSAPLSVIPREIKAHVRNVDNAIYAAAGIEPPHKRTVPLSYEWEHARLLATERRDLLNEVPPPWGSAKKPDPDCRQISTWGSDYAKWRWLSELWGAFDNIRRAAPDEVQDYVLSHPNWAYWYGFPREKDERKV
ncbi:MAG: hypothetical protein R3D52_08920 [Xanthobacteraceae bacterium]